MVNSQLTTAEDQSLLSPHWFLSWVLISFSLENDHSAEATVTGTVAYVLRSIVRLRKNNSPPLSSRHLGKALSLLDGRAYDEWNTLSLVTRFLPQRHETYETVRHLNLTFIPLKGPCPVAPQLHFYFT